MIPKLRADIVEICLSIDSVAARVYQQFGKSTSTEELSLFWVNMAVDETKHLEFWENMVDLAHKGQLENMFLNPEKTYIELKNLECRAQYILETVGKVRDDGAAFMKAYELEFLMVYPAFEILFRLLKTDANVKSPSDYYDDHINSFIMTSNKWGPKTHEATLILDLLARSWYNSKDMASQMEQIRTLRELIPICASCKKIRDDDGYWNHLEHYFKHKFDTEFSHSICPPCAKELYPDLVDGKEM